MIVKDRYYDQYNIMIVIIYYVFPKFMYMSMT